MTPLADFWIDVASPAVFVLIALAIVGAFVLAIALARMGAINDRSIDAPLVPLDLSRERRRQVARRRGGRA